MLVGCVESFIKMMRFFKKVNWGRDRVEIIFFKQADGLFCFPVFSRESRNITCFVLLLPGSGL